MFIVNVIQLLSKLDIEIYKYKNNIIFFAQYPLMQF